MSTFKYSLVEGSAKIVNNDELRTNSHQTWKESLIISSGSSGKAIFDVIILFFVGYSCVTSVFNVSFKFTENPDQKSQDEFWYYFEQFTEYLFILDLLLNFITAYKNPETQEDVVDIK